MAKSTGMGDNLYVDGIDLSGDTGSLSRIGGGPAPLEVTGINKHAFERLGGVRNGAITWSSWWNPTGAHPALSSLPRTDRIITYMHGAAIGSPAASCVAKQINYDPARGADASLSVTVDTQSTAFGVEWGRQLTAGQDSLVTAGALAGYDTGAGSAFGLQAYLHVFSITGTSATVAIQHSDDDAAVDPYANVTDGVFVAATVTGAQRLQTARTTAIKRWLRVNVVGTFTELTFAVQATRNTVMVMM